MSNKPEIEASPSYQEGVYKWYDRLSGKYSRSDSTVGTNASDSMEDTTVLFEIPTGYEATVTFSLTVDDWGTLTVTDSSGNEKLKLSLTSSDDSPGERGGHVEWSDTKSVHLPSGKYKVEIHHENVTYEGEYADKSVYNVSKCNFGFTGTLNVVHPVRYDFEFTTRSEDNVNPDEKDGETNSTYCASGYVFLGQGTVTYNNGTSKTFGIQSGGWMANSSPFTKPTNSQLNNNFNPKQWPDTSCPTAVTAIHTTIVGLGYGIDVDASTGRSAIKLHKGVRFGSEGCISVRNADEWEMIEEDMRIATKVYPKDPLEATVSYSCVQPDYNRYPS